MIDRCMDMKIKEKEREIKREKVTSRVKKITNERKWKKRKIDRYTCIDKKYMNIE